MILKGDTHPKDREHPEDWAIVEFQGVALACDGGALVVVDGDIYKAVSYFIAWDERTFRSRLERMEYEHRESEPLIRGDQGLFPG